MDSDTSIQCEACGSSRVLIATLPAREDNPGMQTVTCKDCRHRTVRTLGEDTSEA